MLTNEAVAESKLPNLTPRQWWLHDFLENQALFFPQKWWNQEEIIEECKRGYPGSDGYQKRYSLKSHELCASITLDMEAINQSDKCDTIIMLFNGKYKMPNSVDEGAEYLEKTILRRSSRGMKTYWMNLRKLKMNGQYKFIANSGRVMADGDEEAAERYVTSVCDKFAEQDKKKKEDSKHGKKSERNDSAL